MEFARTNPASIQNSTQTPEPQESAHAHRREDPCYHLLDDAGVHRNAFGPCHSTKPGENKVGPSLAGVFGRKSGMEPGYSYSSAVKGLNVTWDETT